MKKLTEEEIEFLKESNAIEGEYSQEADLIKAWAPSGNYSDYVRLNTKLQTLNFCKGLMEEREKELFCSTCGFPKNWERNPIFIKNDLLSMICLLEDEKEMRCPECKFWKDGSTIKKIEPLLRKFKEAGENKIKEEQKKKVEELLNEIDNWKKDVIDTEKNQDKKYTDGALITISIIKETIDKIFNNSQQKYAPKNLDAMREKKCSRSESSTGEKSVNTLKEQTADILRDNDVCECGHTKYWHDLYIGRCEDHTCFCEKFKLKEVQGEKDE